VDEHIQLNNLNDMKRYDTWSLKLGGSFCFHAFFDPVSRLVVGGCFNSILNTGDLSLDF
jgi:hypothetical protein